MGGSSYHDELMSEENREFRLRIYEELKIALKDEPYRMLVGGSGSGSQTAIRIEHEELEEPLEVRDYPSQTENAVLGLVWLVGRLHERRREERG
ncbi:MAG: hypothetical protein AAF191_07500 [Verrucomicrobiota bacterium]